MVRKNVTMERGKVMAVGTIMAMITEAAIMMMMMTVAVTKLEMTALLV